MPTLTTSVVERFPEHEMTIERLARSDDIFGSICEDHTVGVEALRRWQQSDDPRRAERIAELRESLAELEEEILRAIEDAESRRRLLAAPSRSAASTST
jgi:uncharacterized protein YdcH (DUF465 family)